MTTKACAIFALLLTTLIPENVWASTATAEVLDFTGHWAGITAVVIFVLAYSLVIAEESIHLRKSKPVMVAAGIIWAIVALTYANHGDTHTAGAAVRHNLLEFGELFLFLLAAMTYINAMDERGVFDVLRVWLVGLGFSLRGIFWITGLLAFFMSPDSRQSHHRPAHGHGGDGGGGRSPQIHHHRLYQHCGGGKCRAGHSVPLEISPR